MSKPRQPLYFLIEPTLSILKFNVNILYINISEISMEGIEPPTFRIGI
jgi:hypothetical protein